jgi:hypothetical protein
MAANRHGFKSGEETPKKGMQHWLGASKCCNAQFRASIHVLQVLPRIFFILNNGVTP